MTPLAAALTAVGALILAAFYAVAESAQLAISPALLDELPDSIEQKDELLDRRPKRHLHCAVLGQLCVALFSLASFILARAVGAGSTEALVAATVATAIFAVGGTRVLLRAWAAYHYALAYRMTARVVGVSLLALGWLTWPFEAALRGLGPRVGLDDPLARPFPLPPDPLQTLVEATGPTPIATEQMEMIENIVDLREATVDEVMTPRTRMVMIDVDEGAEAALKLALDRGHSRIPVYEGTRDAVLGVFYVKDVLPFWPRGEPSASGVHLVVGSAMPGLRELVRPPVFVPESQPIGATLRELQRKRVHVGIVIDEYGGTAGLLTIEDILEEIVGEIEDEHDPQSTAVVRLVGPQTAHVGASAHIDDINELLGVALPEAEDFDTIGGFVFSQLGHIPAVGEFVEYDDLELTVLDADERRIRRVQIRRATGEPLRNVLGRPPSAQHLAARPRA